LGEPGGEVFGGAVDRRYQVGAGGVLGGGVEGVNISGGGVAEPKAGIVLFALQRGRGFGLVVSGKYLLEELDGGGGVDGFGSDDRVRVAVVGDGQVEVVGGAAAGEDGVQLPPGAVAADQAMHGDGGHALGGVDRGRIAELGRFANIAGGQGDRQPAPEVDSPQPTGAGEGGNGPAVAVLDPVMGADAELPVVTAGDDQVADAGPVPVSQLDFSGRGAAGEAVGAGPLVELGD